MLFHGFILRDKYNMVILRVIYKSQTEHNTEMLTVYQLTSLNESQVLEAHGCKPWVTNSLIVPHILGILTANSKYYLLCNTS